MEVQPVVAEHAGKVQGLDVDREMVFAQPDYVFATDELGTNTGHVPRHAKQYADINSELARVQQMRVDALAAFKKDVDSETFPGSEQLIGVEDSELAAFIEMLEKR